MKRQMCIKLEEETIKQLTEIAEKENRTVSQVIRILLAKALEENQK